MSALRIKDVDFGRGEVTVREGKGHKDRRTMLPASVRPALTAHIERVQRLHEKDLAAGFGRVFMPDARPKNAERGGGILLAICLSIGEDFH